MAPLLAAMVAGACARDPIELPSVTVCLPPTSAQRVAVGGAVSDVLASPDGCRVLYRDREATFHDVAIDGLDDRVIGKGMPPYFGARPAIGPRGQWVSLCGESCWLHRFGGETLAFDPPASPIGQAVFSADEETFLATMQNSPVAEYTDVALHGGTLAAIAGAPGAGSIAFLGRRVVQSITPLGGGELLVISAARFGLPVQVTVYGAGGERPLVSDALWALALDDGALVALADGPSTQSIAFVGTDGASHPVARGDFEPPPCASADVGQGEAVSPDRRRALLLERKGDMGTLVSIGPDHLPVAVAPGRSARWACGWWSRNGSRVSYLLADGSRAVHDFHTGAELPLTGIDGGRLPAVLTASGRFARTVDLAIVAVDSGQLVQPAVGPSVAGGWVEVRDELFAWVVRHDSAYAMTIFDAASGQLLEDPLWSTPAAPGAAYGVRSLGGGPGSFLYTVLVDGQPVVRAYRTAARQFETLADSIDPAWFVENTYRDEPRHFLAVPAATGGISVLPLP